jgi:hypothetical protein
MRPREPRDSGQHDLLRARLDQIIDTGHALAKLARTIDWDFLNERMGTVYTDLPGRPPLPTRLMAGLAILKHMHDLSDESLCDRWLENPYYQYFCGEEFFRHKLPFDRSSITRCVSGWEKNGWSRCCRRAWPLPPVQVRQSRHTLPASSSTPRCNQRQSPSRRMPNYCPAPACIWSACQAARRWFAPVLRAPRQDRADPPPALRACQAIQTCQPGAEDFTNAARAGGSRYSSQDQRQRRFAGGLCTKIGAG